MRGAVFFHGQGMILLDGITFGGCNVVDLPAMSSDLGLPVAAVMRRHPKLKEFKHVVHQLPDSGERWRRTEAAGPNGMVIVELSSFQLETTVAFRPHVGVLLDVTPDHLDWHANEEEYRQAKYRVFADCTD